MKVLILCGGSEAGNTSGQCKAFASALPDGWGCSIIDLHSMDIGHCIGCGACSNGPCIHDDGFAVIAKKFDDSNVVVFATPIRFSGPSSIIKTALDRFQALWNGSLGIKRRLRYMTFMANGGSPNPDPRPCRSIFRSFCLSFGGEWIEPHVFPGTDDSIDGLEEGAAAFARQIVEYVEG